MIIVCTDVKTLKVVFFVFHNYAVTRSETLNTQCLALGIEIFCPPALIEDVFVRLQC